MDHNSAYTNVMRVILISSVLLVLVLSLSVALALQVGSNLPPPVLLRDLRFGDCSLPCWIGIVPGQTTLGDGMRRIQAIFALPDEMFPRNPRAVVLITALPLPTFSTASYRVVLGMQLETGVSEVKISEIWWRSSTSSNDGQVSRLTIGDVIGTFGPPTCVYLSPRHFQGWFFIWNLPDGVMEINVDGGNQLLWSHPIDMLTVHNRSAVSETGRHTCSSESANYHPWRGLLNRDRYRRFSSG